MNRVEIKHVSKRYGPDTFALRDIDLDVADTEFTVLLGPSGCGKSTLLRVIAGLEDATSGTISIGGRVVNALAPGDRDVAMVFQDYALYPHMTVEQNLSFGLRMRKTPKREIAQRIREAAAILGLEPFLSRKPAQLSGGQRQRVAIGRAIVRKPQVFLFDEPLSNLDARLRAQTRLELAALHRRLKATTIYVTHDQVEAMTLATRIVLLNRGEIQQIGEPLEIYRRPANAFVASFLGSPGMNLVPAELFSGGPYLLGLRPEAIRLEAAGRPNATVVGVEPLGHETLVIVDYRGHRITARLTETPPLSVGDRVRIFFSAADAHWFEPGGAQRRIEVKSRESREPAVNKRGSP